MKRQTLGVIADFLAVIAFFLALFIAFWKFPADAKLNFDYQAIIVGVMSGLITLLVGWNIYQIVDWKNELKKIEDVKTDLRNVTVFAQREIQENRASALMESATDMFGLIGENKDSVLKFSIIIRRLQALIIAQNILHNEVLISNNITALTISLEKTSHIKLEKEGLRIIYKTCGAIYKSESIPGFQKIMDLLEEA